MLTAMVVARLAPILVIKLKVSLGACLLSGLSKLLRYASVFSRKAVMPIPTAMIAYNVQGNNPSRNKNNCVELKKIF